MTAETPTRERGEPRYVIFFRQGGSYTLKLPATDDIAAYAENNLGTLRVEDLNGHVLWRPK